MELGFLLLVFLSLCDQYKKICGAFFSFCKWSLSSFLSFLHSLKFLVEFTISFFMGLEFLNFFFSMKTSIMTQDAWNVPYDILSLYCKKLQDKIHNYEIVSLFPKHVYRST